MNKKLYLIPIMGLLSNTSVFASNLSEEDQIAAMEALYGPSGHAAVQRVEPSDLIDAYKGMSEQDQIALFQAMSSDEKPARRNSRKKDDFPIYREQAFMSEEDQLAAILAMEENQPAQKNDNNNAHIVSEQDKGYIQSLLYNQLATLEAERKELISQHDSSQLDEIQKHVENLEGRLNSVGGDNPALENELKKFQQLLLILSQNREDIDAKLAVLAHQEEILLSKKDKPSSQLSAKAQKFNHVVMKHENDDSLLQQAINASLEAGQTLGQKNLPPIPSTGRGEVADIQAQMTRNQQAYDELSVKIDENKRAIKDHYSYSTIQHTYVLANKALESRRDSLIAQNLVLQERLDELNNR